MDPGSHCNPSSPFSPKWKSVNHLKVAREIWMPEDGFFSPPWDDTIYEPVGFPSTSTREERLSPLPTVSRIAKTTANQHTTDCIYPRNTSPYITCLTPTHSASRHSKQREETSKTVPAREGARTLSLRPSPGKGILRLLLLLLARLFSFLSRSLTLDERNGDDGVDAETNGDRRDGDGWAASQSISRSVCSFSLQYDRKLLTIRNSKIQRSQCFHLPYYTVHIFFKTLVAPKN